MIGREDKDIKKINYVDLDLDKYLPADELATTAVEKQGTDNDVHWYYGNIGKRSVKHPELDSRMDHSIQVEYGDHPKPYLTAASLNLQKKFKGAYVPVEEEISQQNDKPVGVQWEDYSNNQDNWDKYIMWAKLACVLFVSACYALQAFGYWHMWDTTCRNDFALHYWNCMIKTEKCSRDLNQMKPFYCTEADYQLENPNFCKRGFCSGDNTLCRDDSFQPRVTKFATEWKACMFSKERGKNPCTVALSAEDNGYDKCALGVKIFLFVFFVKDLMIDMGVPQLDEWFGMDKRTAPYWIVVKILMINGIVFAWAFWLREGGNLMGEDMIDLMYVVLFIGYMALLEIIKLFRLQYLDPETMKDKKGKKLNDAECFQKWNRSTQKWKMIFNIILIPIWACFLIIFMSTFKGDVLNIVYFALAPFDEAFSGVSSKDFLLNVNGIMLSTHQSSFKYRSIIRAIFQTAFIMNIVMMVIQVTMCILMADRTITSTYFSDGDKYYPGIAGDFVIIWFFAIDFLANIGVSRVNFFLMQHSGLLANDYVVNLTRTFTPSQVELYNGLLKKAGFVNSTIGTFTVDFRKVGYNTAEKQDEQMY